MKLFPMVCVLAGLVACTASAPTRWATPSDFELITVDNPAEQRFDLTLTSKSNAPMCLAWESWPAQKGLPAGFDAATLNTTSGTHALLPTGSAYCPGGCGEVRLEPNQSVQGVVPYAAFGDATAIAKEADRTLAFGVHPYMCRK